MTAEPSQTAQRWLRLRRRGVCGLVVFLVALMVLQGAPLNINAASYAARWLADWMGAGHYGWSMFAPTPDAQNHRISAEIMDSDDHVLAKWSMPHWPEHSSATRFRKHRWAEYYDNVWMNSNNRCWPALAQHIVNTAKLPPGGEAPPKFVKLIAETKTLPAPTGNRWPKPGAPEGYDDRWVLSNEPLLDLPPPPSAGNPE
ncbi:hypothetical protein [Anatilimnocola floriformis]|uniref:hypothetical protein n=1 Tax=Anatilimnocola floriformis TaxID=2948575 RepID=UPI0020C3E004|nr:hypothetical protein [Anatilimnocola floriformis]